MGYVNFPSRTNPSNALKQNLKVKTFVGTGENALRIQIWTALIAILLLKWLHHLSKARWSLSNLASMLRMNLFTYAI
jgi:IS4 transposase